MQRVSSSQSHALQMQMSTALPMRQPVSIKQMQQHHCRTFKHAHNTQHKRKPEHER